MSDYILIVEIIGNQVGVFVQLVLVLFQYCQWMGGGDVEEFQVVVFVLGGLGLVWLLEVFQLMDLVFDVVVFDDQCVVVCFDLGDGGCVVVFVDVVGGDQVVCVCQQGCYCFGFVVVSGEQVEWIVYDVEQVIVVIDFFQQVVYLLVVNFGDFFL